MSDKFLDKAYALTTPQDTQALYDAWAATYDAEVSDNGYATPGRTARLLAQHLPDLELPVLDFACGTGLSGLALKLAGIPVIDGMDISPEMLDAARRKSVYRDLICIEADDPTPVPQNVYRAITAIGAIGPGAAPVETIDTLMRALPPGGLLAFSLNDLALKDPQYEAQLAEWLDCGAARLLAKEYGPHLPGHDLNANVYVVEKA